VLEDRQPRHQSRRQWRAARIIRVDRPKLPFQELPIHRAPQRHQRMLHVDDLVKPGPEQVLLSRLSRRSRGCIWSLAKAFKGE
jgi:hypothetical protein